MTTYPDAERQLDLELVERARAGDRAAFGELVRRHQRHALRLAYVICGSKEEAEDAVQDAFVNAYRALGTFRPDGELRPWLFRIVANQAKNRVRSSGRRARLSERVASIEPAASAPTGAVAAPDESAVAGADAAVVVAAIARLPDREQLAIAYRYFAGFSEAEIVDALGWPAGTVKSRLSRGIGRLRTMVAESLEVRDG
jgi:RNA polymerase sigma-70 factor (ECF subfamily)